jgi:hypothetical protein
VAIGDGALGDVGVGGDGVVFVGDPGVQVGLDGHARTAEGQRVGDVFVAEDVELPDLDVGRRQTGGVGEPGGSGRRVDRLVGDSFSEQGVPAGDVVVVAPGRERCSQVRCLGNEGCAIWTR